MLSSQFLSTTVVETWAGVDINTLGPIYPMVGSEFILFIIGLIFWVGFHFAQAKIGAEEMDADEAAAKDPERLKRIFAKEAETG